MFQQGRIQSAAAIAVLASPVRQELIDTVEALGGSATVRELADQLGRPADGLYYHVEMLRKAGLLVASSGRSRAGRDERRYRIPVRRGDRLRLVYRPEEKANAAAVRGVARGMLRIARRDFEAALARPGVAVEGPARALWASRSTGWLSPAELRELNRLLRRVADMLDHPRDGKRRHLASLVFVLAPLQARPRRR
jgi:hypothetical protein